MILFCDTETFCDVPIANGTHAYAERAEIMIETWAIDDGPVQIADRTAGEVGPWAVHDPEDFDEIVFHKSDFDRNVYRHCDGLVIPAELVVDTMVQAMSHGLPGGLDKLCDIFQVDRDKAKDKAGKALIQLFCKPRRSRGVLMKEIREDIWAKHGKGSKEASEEIARLTDLALPLHRATRHTHPVEWERFKDYAKLDIAAMREIRRKMPRWNYPGRKGDNRSRERELWLLDQRMNERGFKVDTDLARAAIDTVAAAKRIMDGRTQALTGDALRSTTQRGLLKDILAEFGVDLPDMQSSTLERRIEDPNLPWYVCELLAMRLQVSTTSNAKYNRLLKSVSSDGRLRGTLRFCGAPRTKRWSGVIFQPQNLPRPNMAADDIALGIEVMKAGGAELIYDEPTKLASNALRGAIVADEGRKLVVSDLAQVEARVLPWLAGEQWKLDAFAAYDRGEAPDNYVMAYARGFNVKPGDVTKEFRQIGKVSELSCGYGGSKGAWMAMGLLYGFELPEAQVLDIVRAWRSAHPAICDWTTGFWAQLEEAARRAILEPNRSFEAGEHIRFERWREWLRMELPSGGHLSYARPAIAEDPRRKGSTAISFMGVNNYTKRWERLFTYGGKLSADCLSGETNVLTPSGWKRLKLLEKSDLLWDGSRWVEHEGLVEKGWRFTRPLDGVWMTADHRVCTQEGWKNASSCKGHYRLAVGLPDRSGLCRFQWAQVPVDSFLLVREVDHSGSYGDDQRQAEIVWMPTQLADLEGSDDPRHVLHPPLQNMGRNERPLPPTDRPRLSQLRGPRHRSLQGVARFVRGLLARYEGGIPALAFTRSPEQQSRIFERQLLLGDSQGAGTQHSAQSADRHAMGQDNRSRGLGALGNRCYHPPLPLGCWGGDAAAVHPSGRYEPVLDVVNAGTMNCFTVLGAGGPLLVHNCTQATAREIMAHNLPAIEEAGFPPVLVVHDEVVTEPLDDVNFSVDRLNALLARRPEWADERLPLAAGGFEAYRYRKE